MTSIDSIHSNHSQISSENRTSHQSIDFWKFVSRKTLHIAINLNERVWRVFSSFEWAETFHQKALLRLVLFKLEETTITADNLLTESERAQALLSVIGSLDTNSHSFHHEFANEIQKRGFLFNFSDKKEELAHEIRRFRSPISPADRRDNFKKLEQFLDPRLLYTQKGALISFTASEFEVLRSLFSKIGPNDHTIGFKHLVAFTKNAFLSDKLILIGQHSIWEGPFLVEGTLVTSDFEPPKLDCLQALLHYFPHLHDAPLIHQKIDTKSLNIQEATALGLISRFASFMFPSVEKDKLTLKERELYDLIERLPTKPATGPRYHIDLWISLESRLQEIQTLRERKEKGEQIFVTDEALLWDVYWIKNDFKDFISLHESWPCPIIQELSRWENAEGTLEADIESLKKDLQTYQKKYQDKIKSKDPKHLADLKDRQFLTEFVHHLSPLKPILPPHFLEDIRQYLAMFNPESHEKLKVHFDPLCPINVCFVKPPSFADYPLWLKIKYTALSFLMPYEHANFSFKEDDQPKKLGLGVNVYEEKISGFESAKIETYALKPERLVDQTLTQEQIASFKSNFHRFFLRKKTAILRDHYYPRSTKHIVLRFLSGLLPTLFAERPAIFLNDETKELFCSEFVMQTIAETVQLTCESLLLSSPPSMSVFGVRSLKGITPNELRSKWLAKGIIQ